ncbi:hypothetical protein CPB84DRAFT_1803017 [Gymnopilus junonius]|uniref:Pheromone n=1 Tax=Gymnopilus junonius TaxID=109634 RepID=A0A9P5N7M0_GYMJU|nr:hypothetical protein CPB84DRAFT_1803017 [Gymnopilus junonius]
MDSFDPFDFLSFLGVDASSTRVGAIGTQTLSSSTPLPCSSTEAEENQLLADFEVRSGTSGPSWFCIVA